MTSSKKNIQKKPFAHIDNDHLVIFNQGTENRYNVNQIKSISITEAKTNWYSTIFLNLIGFLLFNSVDKRYKEKQYLELEIYSNNSLNFNKASYDLDDTDLKKLKDLISQINKKKEV